MTTNSGNSQAENTPAEPGKAVLTKTALVDLIRKFGCPNYALSKLEFDLESGAPSNADGTMSLLSYTAWLVKQASEKSTE